MNTRLAPAARKWLAAMVVMSSVAIVTGAGSGIGRATALMLAARGFCLVLAGRSEQKLVDTGRLIGQAPWLVVPLDLSEPSARPRLVELALQRFGAVDALVNNAGSARQVPIAHTGPELWREAVAIHADAPAELIIRLWPHMLSQRRGVIVNVSSLAAHDPFDGFLAYGAAKAALESLARSVMREGGAHGITAYNVAAGMVETPLLRSLFDTRAVPEHLAHAPEHVASIIVACVCGERPRDAGKTILVPNK